MTKKAVIMISLVEESVEKANEEIEKDVLEELSEGIPRIPWFKKRRKSHGDRCLKISRLSQSFGAPTFT